MALAVTVLHGFAFLRGGRDNGMGAAVGNGIVASTCVIGTISRTLLHLSVRRIYVVNPEC